MTDESAAAPAGAPSGDPIARLSDDQEAAFSLAADTLREIGLDLRAGTLTPTRGKNGRAVAAITGKAGSGKTLLLGEIVRRMLDAGMDQVSSEWEARKRPDRLRFAVLAPTNKAASVLRGRGVAATTIHRILYIPVYAEELQAIIDWLEKPESKPRPEHPDFPPEALDRALAFYQESGSIPAALAAIGLRGAEFISGWTRREEELDVALVDEASMIDDRQLADLREIFSALILFGDPAQLPPVQQSGAMSFDKLPEDRRAHLHRVHRQTADNPILDLAYALQEDDISFFDFEDRLRRIAERDDRVVVAQRLDPAIMSRAPALVWRNVTRLKMINAFRGAYGLAPDALSPGEPLICDGIELPAKQRKHRIALEAAGLVKGAQVYYRGPGERAGVARLWVCGAEKPKLKAASIIKIERPGDEEPFMASAARMGALFVHGAACTIHKAQGSQWPAVQVFAPDLLAAERAGRIEAGVPLWRRLAYVAITRAEERLLWVVRPAIAKPEAPLGADDLA